MSMYGSPSVSFFLIGGYSLLGAKPQGYAEKTEAIQARTDGLGDTWDEFTPTGAKKATLSQEGMFFDVGTNLAHAALNGSQTTSRVMCIAREGNVAGKHFVGYAGAYAGTYDVLAKLNDLTKADVSYTISGARDEGQILQILEAKTADWNTESAGEVDYTLDTTQRVIPITSNSQANPTVVTTPVPHGLTTGQVVIIAGETGSSPTINGQRTVTVISATTFSVPVNTSAGTGGTGGTIVLASTVNGGIGFQQVTAFSGFTGFVGKIRDSADDSTYADLVTFANVTSAPSAEAVAVTGTVDRYLAVDGNVTGTGSLTLMIGFARR